MNPLKPNSTKKNFQRKFLCPKNCKAVFGPNEPKAHSGPIRAVGSDSGGKIHPTVIALLGVIALGLILLVTASLTSPIPDQILSVNSSSELDLSTYFPEFSENVWFSG